MNFSIIILFRFTDLYQEFQGIYEKKLEELIYSCDTTPDEFFDALKTVIVNKSEM